MSTPSQSGPTPPTERRSRARFDSMKVWEEASAALLANREVLLAVMGVFVILPVFAVIQFLPPPEQVAGQKPDVIVEHMGAYFNANWLPILAATVLQLLGMLITLALLGDPGRPTVSEAIRQAAKALPSFLAALLAGYIFAMLSGLIPAAIIGLSGSLPLTLVGVAMGAVVVLYLLVRFAHIGPFVLLGGELNPISALRRSYLATKGVGWQMLVFFLLIYVAYSIVGWLAQAALKITFTFVAGAATGNLAGNIVDSIVQAALAATFVAAIAASYRQSGAAAA